MRIAVVTMFALFADVPVASAHLGLMDPVSRYGMLTLKDPPCGRTGGLRGENIYTFSPGETIEIRWNEYIDHPGHYRVSFDDDGDDAFTNPRCIMNCTSRSDPPTVFEFDSALPVLLDNIPDMVGGDYAVSVTLPNVECDNCTIQVIQVMTDKRPITFPGDDLYYQCIDVVLEGPTMPGDAGGVIDAGGPRDAGGAGDAGTTMTTEDDGCSVASSGRSRGAGFLAVVLPIGALLLHRRTRKTSRRQEASRRP